MENYVKIIEEAVKSLTRIPKFADAVKGHDITLNGIIAAMQTILKDTELTKAFCECMTASIADDYYFNHYDMKGNIHIVITDSSVKNMIEKWEKEVRERNTLNDTSTEEIVSHLLNKGRGKISYSDIYDEVIKICIANYGAITEFNYENILQNFPTIDTMKKIYQEVMENSSPDFYKDLKDEFMLNFRYIEDSNTISLSERLSGGGNSNAGASTQKSRMIKYLHEDINKLPLPNKEFFQRLSNVKRYNPYSLNTNNITVSEYNSFISLLLSRFEPSSGQKQEGPTLLFKIKNRESCAEYKPFELYYCEEVFKPSYVKRFATDLYKKISEYINERWTKEDMKNLFHLQSTVKNITISQKEFQKKYLSHKSTATFERLDKMLDDAIADVKRLYSSFITFYDNCKIISSRANIKGVDGYGENGITHNPGSLEIVSSAIISIKDFLGTNKESLNQNQRALIQAAYLISNKKLYFEERSIFVNEKAVISAFNLTQSYGEKEIFDQCEKISGALILTEIVKTAKEILTNPSLVDKKKIQTQSANAQKILCNIIHDAILYCCNIVNREIIKPYTSPGRFSKILINDDEIQTLYNDLYGRYSVLTGDGRSLICRAFLEPKFDSLNMEYISYLHKFKVLNNDVIEYIYRKIKEVSSILSERQQMCSNIKVECDHQYVYSYNFYNQLNEIRDNLFSSNGDNNYEIITAKFDFNTGFNSNINKCLNKKLMEIYHEYISKFINNLFK